MMATRTGPTKVKDHRYTFLADAMGVGGGLPFDEDEDLGR